MEVFKMTDNIKHYINGKEKSLCQCTDHEIDIVMDEYEFRDSVNFIKHLCKVIREQNWIIDNLAKNGGIENEV